MLVEIHMLKNYPITNLNRDESGSPKSCVFGGVQRGRISSQCLKRSWRKSSVFEAELGSYDLGIRTRKMPELVSDILRENGIEEEYVALACRKLTGVGNGKGTENKKGDTTAQIILYSKEDLNAIAFAVMELIKGCKSAKEFDKIKATEIEKQIKGAKTRPITLDIALFGRMVTSDAFANVEAAMQVAHAFSTNRIEMESDFFTAMDDLIDGNEETGSGMMGDIDCNSACYYMYASLDVEKLRENLKNTEHADEITAAAIPALLKAMAFSNPSGKQNSFAGHSLPSAVLVECKEYPVPVSYANAFVKPVYAAGNLSLIEASIAKFTQFAQQTIQRYGIPVKERFWFCLENGFSMENAVNCGNYNELIQGVCDTVGMK